MKKKNTHKKLELNRETLRRLDPADLRFVDGAVDDGQAGFAGCTSTAGPPCEDE